ncbi:hypothetical protein [Nostoc flagelliforme]|nr:hypothetical protein [Nostoc flagelliforme]
MKYLGKNQAARERQCQGRSPLVTSRSYPVTYEAYFSGYECPTSA